MLNHRVVHETEESVAFVIDALLFVPVVLLRRIAQDHVEAEVGELRLNLAEGGKALIGETGEIVLTLDIEPGWHVNANPASMEFLIPTVVNSSVNGQALEIPTQYPRGRVSDIVLGDTALEVYDDGASIRLRPDGKQIAVLEKVGRLEMIVRAQACSDEGVCLAPTDMPVALNLDDTSRQ